MRLLGRFRPDRAEKIRRNVESRFGVRATFDKTPMHWNGKPGWTANAWAPYPDYIEESGFGGTQESAARRLHKRLSRRRRGLMPDTMFASMRFRMERAVAKMTNG